MDADIPFARPFIGLEEETAVLRTLRSGWLTTAAEALAFEREFAGFLSRPPDCLDTEGPGRETPACREPPLCLAVNSATSGLHLLAKALCPDMGPGDVALVPSYTFAATAGVVRYSGAEVVFVDNKAGSFHIDPEQAGQTLDRLSQGLPAYPRRGAAQTRGFGPQGKARLLIPVHFGGLPCDMDALKTIGGRYAVKIMEDAAHAFPAALPGNAWAGDASDGGVFSFYATKTITTGEGGMVVVRDPALARRIALLRSHGIDRTIWNRYADPRASWYYEVLEPGFKYNLPDLLAALGRAQLSRAADLLGMRKRIARMYDAAFGDCDQFLLPPTGPGDARHLYPLRIKPETLTVNRDELISVLQARGIGVSVHFIPLHCMPYYKKRYALEAEDFPEALRCFQRELSLPLWPGMSDAQVNRVIDTVTAAVRENRR
ncbi:MAG: DegT/DnrJ/EryC1/StrS aminotransferase family protein [Treponema sp.]|jgi:dTDP-4-amino-4,6-dideoxygalactose transaminase|nr:DegT/DnrJ/EryC1/StrS aminotransferase family protein [Treponema sp.]